MCDLRFDQRGGMDELFWKMRTEFHDKNETREIHDFFDWIGTVEEKVWRLCIQKRF